MPRRSNTSVSERTIVVFPVPPFCDRTAIASDIAGTIWPCDCRATGSSILPAPLSPSRTPARRRRGTREVGLASFSTRPPSAPAESRRFSPEVPYRPRVSPPSVEDRDACAIYASVRKDATPERAPVELALTNLQKMLHRAGHVDGEGDGCGILVDVPRKLWAERVRAGGHNPALALDDAFAVAHVFFERTRDVEGALHDARGILGRGGFRILDERLGGVDSHALGPTAREEEPHFWQVGGLLPDLRDERFETVGCFGHNRYSTNTWPSFKRVQPFTVLGHNGEINTIEQLRQEAQMLGIQISAGNSDSQDLNRVVDHLVRVEGFSLPE